MTTPPQALIFDMDELLVQSKPIWVAAETALLRAIGQPWTEELATRYKGMNAFDVARAIHGIFAPPLPLERCQELMRHALIAGFGGPVAPMAGAVDLVRRVRGHAPLAVASGSPLAAIEAALRQLGIHECFERIITSECVARGKRHPDVFLAAAKALQTGPGECLVFEDSLVGVQAAKAAGMRCYAVPSLPVPAIRTLADRTFASLADVTLADLGW